MNPRIPSLALALCCCLPALPTAHAWQDTPPSPCILAASDAAITTPFADEVKVPTSQEAYKTLIAFKDKDGYKEGDSWTNEDHPNYKWNGGPLEGNVTTGAGCVAFAFELSDAAFGALPARMTRPVQLSDVKVGDILRVDGGAHTVIVLQVTSEGVIIAEGNYNGTVHWERPMSKAEVERADALITRYPEGYDPDDSSSNDPTASGDIPGTSLSWSLTKGILTISGSGDMPDLADDQPWNAYASQILGIVIENGVTRVGANMFRKCNALNVKIPASVTDIGSNAFRECPNLVSVSIADGVRTIGGNAFYGCTKLESVSLPASLESIGAAVFFQCTELTEAYFAPSSKNVEIGDNLFSSCWKLAKVTLPTQINRIGTGMFMNCLTLSDVVISKGAESIGQQAFASCSSLQSVTIPDSVTLIEATAFSSCGALKDIYFSGSEEQWNNVRKIADTAGVLDTKTIHYNSSIPDPEPPAETDPPTDPEPPTETDPPTDPEPPTETDPPTDPEPPTETDPPTDPEPPTETDPPTDPEPPVDPDPGHAHTWDSGTVTKAASCTAPGVRTFTCSDCGETRTESISALGHNYQSAPGEKLPTCTEAGEKTSVCTRCKDIQTEEVPATGHQLILNDSGAYQCANERGPDGQPVTVVTAPIAEAYLAVKAEDGHKAPSFCPDADAALKACSEAVRKVLTSVSDLVSFSITTIRFTPPTQTVDGEYVYQVTLFAKERAAASSLTSEPFRMILPAGSAPAPTPDPKPTPPSFSDRNHSGSSSSSQKTKYSVSVRKTTGGSVDADVRYASKGDRVTLTVRPDDGFALSELSVVGAQDQKVSLEDLGENRFRFVMPVGQVEIYAAFTDSASAESENPDTSTAPTAPLPFTDTLPSDWFYSSVEYVWQHGLMKGVSDTQFAPQRTTSRAMIWMILARMNDVSTDPAPDSVWYEKGLQWAMEQGVSDGSNPLQNITREQLAVMLWRVAGRPGGGSLDAFQDAGHVSGYAVDAMQWAVDCGILQGNAGFLNPKATATRAATAAMITRFTSNV